MRKNGSLELALIQSENYFSPYGCQRAEHASRSYSVTLAFLFSPLPYARLLTCGNGGPGWTRTSDPTLIKRVL
jgi:hypothetical protein